MSDRIIIPGVVNGPKGPERTVIPGAINGIDLCPSIQVNVNWDKVYDAGFSFVYIQASRYSKVREANYPRCVDRAREAGLLVGAYHFCSHDTDPAEQAQHAYDSATDRGSIPLDLPLMVDWEHCTPSYYMDRPHLYPLGHPAHCVAWLEDFLDELVQLCGHTPTVYTYPDYAKRHETSLSLATGLSAYPLTYASYHHKKGYVPESLSEVPFHKVPKPWERATLVQYSGNDGAYVPGVAGRCDRLVFKGRQNAEGEIEEDWNCFRGAVNGK